MKYRKKFIFAVLILAIVLAAGCTGRPTEECINPLVNDEKCIQSQASPTATEPAVVVKPFETTITPVPTEAIPAIPVDAKMTTLWYPINNQDVNFFGIKIRMLMQSEGQTTGKDNVVIVGRDALFKQHRGFAQLVVKVRYKNKATSEISETEALGMFASGGRIPDWSEKVGDANPSNLEWQADFSLQNYSRGSKLNN